MTNKISFVLKNKLSEKEESAFLSALEENEICSSARILPHKKDSKSSLAGRLGFAEASQHVDDDQLVQLLKSLPEIEDAQVEIVRKLVAKPKDVKK